MSSSNFLKEYDDILFCGFIWFIDIKGFKKIELREKDKFICKKLIYRIIEKKD